MLIAAQGAVRNLKTHINSLEDVVEIQEIDPVGVLYFDVPIGRRRAIREHLDGQGIPYEEDKGLARSWFVAQPDAQEAMVALKKWLRNHGVH